MIRLPWFLRWLRIVAIYLMEGPGAFCWHLGCWQRSAATCHASMARGNGRMCADHCEEASYHSKWRTGCDKVPSYSERVMFPEVYAPKVKDCGTVVHVEFRRDH